MIALIMAHLPGLINTVVGGLILHFLTNYKLKIIKRR